MKKTAWKHSNSLTWAEPNPRRKKKLTKYCLSGLSFDLKYIFSLNFSHFHYGIWRSSFYQYTEIILLSYKNSYFGMKITFSDQKIKTVRLAQWWASIFLNLRNPSKTFTKNLIKLNPKSCFQVNTDSLCLSCNKIHCEGGFFTIFLWVECWHFLFV